MNSSLPEWYDSLRERLSLCHEYYDIERGEDPRLPPFSEDSRQRALGFAKQLVGYGRPGGFTIGNGNTRLLWTNEAKESVGLQFLPRGLIQYVMLRQVDEATPMKIFRGYARPEEMLHLINTSEMRHVLMREIARPAM